MTGIERIAAERKRQIEQEGFGDRHDDRYSAAVLPAAAVCYIEHILQPRPFGSDTPTLWPWDDGWWKPSNDKIRDLEKAGALIAAEIDRLERLRSRA